MKTDKDDRDRGHDHNEGHGGDHDKAITIIVNTREKKVEGKEVSYDQIVGLAFENPPTGEFIEITITYREGPGRDGSLQPGKTVKIKERMVFDVTATDKS